MRGVLKSIVFIIMFVTVFATVPATAQEASGGLRYSVTVTRFENQAGWHGKAPKDEQLVQALKELEN